MAKNSNFKPSAPSRIRFVMVDAEIANDGDFSQITQAIQNALRGPAPVQTKRLGSSGIAAAVVEPEVDVEVEAMEEDNTISTPSAPSKPRAPRKASPAPDIVDIDMNADVSLATFAQGKDAGSQHKKYLISAAWLKEHRNIDAVSAGHIYTCFRSMDWSTNIPDFWQPLRDLKAKRLFAKNEQGDYEINHIGLDTVKKLGGSNGAG